MNVIFRVDSSYQIGTGHIYRCLRLAHELSSKGHKIEFICKQLPGEIASKTLLPIFPVNWIQNENDATDILKVGKFDVLIVDHYWISALEEAAFRPHVGKLLVIDDLENRTHICDLLLDTNYKRASHRPYQDLIPQEAKKLVGPSFALLDSRYAELHNECKARQKIRSICLFFGGTDEAGETHRWYEAAKRNANLLAGLVLHFVVARSNQQIDHFLSLSDSALIKVHIQPDNLAEIMAKCDFYIGSGGTITWERSCLGLTGYVISVVDNQIKIAEDLDADGYQHYLGSHLKVDPDQILAQINSNKELEKWLTLASSKSLSLTDGTGLKKVSKEIEKLF